MHIIIINLHRKDIQIVSKSREQIFSSSKIFFKSNYWQETIIYIYIFVRFIGYVLEREKKLGGRNDDTDNR